MSFPAGNTGISLGILDAVSQVIPRCRELKGKLGEDYGTGCRVTAVIEAGE